MAFRWFPTWITGGLDTLQLGALDELWVAADEALTTESMSSHGGGAGSRLGVDSGFMRYWYERLRSDSGADAHDLREFGDTARAVTPQAIWDARVSETSALLVWGGPPPDNAVTRAVATVAGAVVKAAKVPVTLVTQGAQAAGDAARNLGNYLASALGYLKWILLGLAAVAILLLLYKVSGFVRWLASSPASSSSS